jgi:septum formation protein
MPESQAIRFYLASRSPRRAEILRQLGLHFMPIDADIDETPHADEPIHAYVQRMARSKALCGLENLRLQKLPALPVLAADTSVYAQGEILGKPHDTADAMRMLSKMSGQWHEVYTAVALTVEEELHLAVSLSRVLMAQLSTDTLLAYIASGEPTDKAGAYGIQGLGSVLVERIEGSYSGIMGLPIYETTRLLALGGISVLPATQHPHENLDTQAFSNTFISGEAGS